MSAATATQTVRVDALSLWDGYILPARLKPNRRKAAPKGAVVYVMGSEPSPIPGITRLFVLLPHGEIRTVPMHSDDEVTLV